MLNDKLFNKTGEIYEINTKDLLELIKSKLIPIVGDIAEHIDITIDNLGMYFHLYPEEIKDIEKLEELELSSPGEITDYIYTNILNISSNQYMNKSINDTVYLVKYDQNIR